MPNDEIKPEHIDPRIMPKKGRVSLEELSEALHVKKEVILEWVQYKAIPYVKRPFSLEFDTAEIGRWLTELIEKDSEKREII